MFHTLPHKLPAAALRGLPIRTLADYIAQVDAFESAASEFDRLDAEHEFKCQCDRAVNDALCADCNPFTF